MISFLFIIISVTFSIKPTKEMVNILLDSVPEDFDFNGLQKQFILIKGVQMMHDLHVWEYNQGKIMLMVHLEIEENYPPDKVLRKATVICRQFGIYHSTIQVEKQRTKHKLVCAQNIHN